MQLCIPSLRFVTLPLTGGSIPTSHDACTRLHVRMNARTWSSQAPRKERKQIHFAMVDALSALHSVDPQAVGLDGFGKMGGFYTRQIKTMRRVSDAQVGATNGAVPHFQRGEELLRWFEGNLPPDSVSVVRKMCNIVSYLIIIL